MPWWLGPLSPVIPCAVEGEDDGQSVERHVVDHLVPCAVQEGAVDRDDRAQATHRHAGGTGDGVLLGDAHVEEPVREADLERDQPGRSCHRSRDRNQLGVGLGLLDDGLRERLRVPGGHGLRRADRGIEDGGVVQVLLVVVLRRRVAATLLGEDVHQDRALRGELDSVVQRALELLDVVPVDGTGVTDAQRLEERRGLQELANGGLEGLDALLGLQADVGQITKEVLDAPLATERTPGSSGCWSGCGRASP
jgi:hypothetical protein